MELLSEALAIQREFGSAVLARRAVHRLHRTLLHWLYEVRYTALGRPVIPMETPEGVVRLEVDKEWERLGEIASGVTYEPQLLQTLSEHLDKDDVFYNVGARWGSISRFVSRCGVLPQRIHNFEADTERYLILKRNLEPGMHATNVFVGDTLDDGHVTLDQYADTYDPPTAIKIDVEGAELSVLRGAASLLEAHRPELYVEIHPEYKQPVEDGKGAVIDELRSYNYDVEVAREHRSEVGSWAAPEAAELDADGNYLLRAF